MKSINNMTLAEMQAEIISKSKTLNTRLRRLEELYQTTDDIGGYSYTKIKKIGAFAESINKNWRSQQPRFSTAKPKTINEARRVLAQVRKAYNVKGATKTAINKMYEGQAQALNDLYNNRGYYPELTSADIKKFHSIISKIDKAVANSDEVIRVILESKRIKNEGGKLPFKDTVAGIVNYINKTDFPADTLNDIYEEL